MTRPRGELTGARPRAIGFAVGVLAVLCSVDTALAHPWHWRTTTPSPGPIESLGSTELLFASLVFLSIPAVGTVWYVRRRRTDARRSDDG